MPNYKDLMRQRLWGTWNRSFGWSSAYPVPFSHFPRDCWFHLLNHKQAWDRRLLLLPQEASHAGSQSLTSSNTPEFRIPAIRPDGSVNRQRDYHGSPLRHLQWTALIWLVPFSQATAPQGQACPSPSTEPQPGTLFRHSIMVCWVTCWFKKTRRGK